MQAKGARVRHGPDSARTKTNSELGQSTGNNAGKVGSKTGSGHTKIRRLSQPVTQETTENIGRGLNPILKNNFQLDNIYDEKANTYDKAPIMASSQSIPST